MRKIRPAVTCYDVSCNCSGHADSGCGNDSTYRSNGNAGGCDTHGCDSQSNGIITYGDGNAHAYNPGRAKN